MIKKIDFDMRTDKNGNPYHAEVDFERMIPSDHKYLFEFIEHEKEFRKINKELEEAVMNDLSMTNGDKRAILTTIRSSHPFYETFPDAAVMLLNYTIASYIKVHTRAADKDRAQLLFEKLKFNMHDTKPDEAESDTIEDYLQKDEEKQDETVDSLIETIRYAKLFIYLVLDNSDERLAKLSDAKRNAMFSLAEYGAKFTKKAHPLYITSKVSLPQAEQFPLWEAVIDFGADVTKNFKDEVNTFIDHPDKLPKYLVKITDEPDQETTSESEQVYHVLTLPQLIRLELLTMAADKTTVLHCKKCGRLFAVEKEGQEFCNYEVPDGISHYQSYLRQKEYRKYYKTQYARQKRGDTSKEEFDEWKDSAEKIRDDLKDQDMPIAKYAELIRDLYNKNTGRDQSNTEEKHTPTPGAAI